MARKMMTPECRRIKARKCRAMVRLGDWEIAQVAEAHKITRAYVYHIVAELEAWEETTSQEVQIAEVNHQFPEYDPGKWLLVSTPIMLKYVRGEIEVDLLGKDPNAGAERDIAMPEEQADPLMG